VHSALAVRVHHAPIFCTSMRTARSVGTACQEKTR
jgi:hypothetical protein